MKRRHGYFFSISLLGTLLAVFLAFSLASPPLPTGQQEGKASRARGRSPAERPASFEERGRLVCLPEEVKKRYGAEVPPVHEHILGFRVEGENPKAAPRYYLLLKTSLSKALFEDKRFKKRVLVLSGRVFPRSAVLDITRFRWIQGGKLYDVYYWCEVCSITGVDPGPCACCQGPVELRERAVPEVKKGPRGKGVKG